MHLSTDVFPAFFRKAHLETCQWEEGHNPFLDISLPAPNCPISFHLLGVSDSSSIALISITSFKCCFSKGRHIGTPICLCLYLMHSLFPYNQYACVMFTKMHYFKSYTTLKTSLCWRESFCCTLYLFVRILFF